MSKICKIALFIFLNLLIITSVLYPQDGKTDLERQGLSGRVKELIEEKITYSEKSGDYKPGRRVKVQKLLFNRKGNITTKFQYNNDGTQSSKWGYFYDSADRTIGKTQHNYSGVLVLNWERSFNNKGSVIEETRYRHDRTLQTKIISTYDKFGNMLEQLTSDEPGRRSATWKRTPDSNGYVIEYTDNYRKEFTAFDKNARIVEKFKRNSDYSEYLKWTYSYNDSGRIKNGEFYRDRFAKPETWIIKYDGEGNIIETVHKKPDGSLHSRRAYSYGRTNKLIKQKTTLYEEDGSVGSTWTYIYDHSGNIIEEVYYNPGKSFESRWTYVYDDWDHRAVENYFNTFGFRVWSAGRIFDPEGNLIEESYFGKDDALKSKTVYTYDRHGNLTDNIRYNSDSSFNNRSKTIYTYDNHGNWTASSRNFSVNEKESYDKPVEMRYRTIIYY